jgi:multidrug resistance efflux pump
MGWRPTRWLVPVLILLGAAAMTGRAGAGEDRSEGKHPPKKHVGDAVVVACAVDTTTTIVWVRPAGALVKAGDQLCELDSTRFRERLQAEKTLAERSRVDLTQAALHREAAELAVAEDDALGRHEREAARGAVALAVAAVEVALARLDEARAADKVDPEAVRQAERALEAARREKPEAERRADRLEKVERPERARALAAALATARGEETARAEAVERARARVEAAARQVERCRVLAPAAGRLVYVRWRDPGGSFRYESVETGAPVAPNQVLFRIVPERAGSRAPR